LKRPVTIDVAEDITIATLAKSKDKVARWQGYVILLGFGKTLIKNQNTATGTKRLEKPPAIFP